MASEQDPLRNVKKLAENLLLIGALVGTLLSFSPTVHYLLILSFGIFIISAVLAYSKLLFDSPSLSNPGWRYRISTFFFSWTFALLIAAVFARSIPSDATKLVQQFDIVFRYGIVEPFLTYSLYVRFVSSSSKLGVVLIVGLAIFTLAYGLGWHPFLP